MSLGNVRLKVEGPSEKFHSLSAEKPSQKRKREDHDHPQVSTHGSFHVRTGTKAIKKIDHNQSLIQQDIETHKKIRRLLQSQRVNLSAPVTQQQPLAEEMQSLAASLALLPTNSPLIKIISDYCKSYKQTALQSIAQSPTQNLMNNPAYLKAQEFLAKIIFLVDRNPQQIAGLISGASSGISPDQAILKSFEDEMGQIAQRLTGFENQIKSVNITNGGNGIQAVSLQNSDIALSMRKPIAIARILVTEGGFVNAGLSEEIKANILNNEVSLDYEEDVIKAMDQLRSSPSLRQKIQAIVKPDSPSYNSNVVVRAVLGLPADSAITDINAKRTAVSAILSNLRQGPVGSCFATSLGIELLHLRLDKCLDDFASIIKNDGMSRIVNGQKRNFDYILDIADDDLNTKFNLSNTGQLDSGALLSNSLGIQAACKIMGIQDPNIPTIVVATCQKIAGPNVSLSQVIDAIAGNIGGSNSQNLAAIGKIAFSAQTNNALLRVWESTLASMAEGKSTDFIHGDIIIVTSLALDQVLVPTNLTDSGIIQKINQVFKDTVDQSMDVRYDPSIMNSSVSADGHSTQGAFVPYQSDPTTVSATGKRIDDPNKFKTFIQNMLQATSASIRPTLRVSTDQSALDALIQKAINFVTTDSNFLKLVITNIDPANKQNPDPVGNWQQLAVTPWLAKTGDDNAEVYATYMEQTKPTPTSYTPSNAQGLLVYGINFAKTLQQRYKFLDDTVPNQRFQVSTPTHAFSFIPEHPTMVPAVRDTGTPSAWVNTNLVQPGTAISNAAVPPQVKSDILSFVGLNLAPANYKDTINSILPSSLQNANTLKSLRDGILGVLRNYTQPSSLASAQGLLDWYLLYLMSQNQIAAGQKIPVVHFADTNWNNGDLDIHFCMYYSPLSGQIEFGMVNEDGSSLNALQADEWITGQQWNFFDMELQSI